MTDSENTTVDPTWKTIRDFPGYWITPQMKVFKNGDFDKALKPFRVQKPNGVKVGKKRIWLTDFQGNKRSVQLERLYLAAFGQEALTEIQIEDLM